MSDKLKSKIDSYLSIPDIGLVIRDAADLIIRMRLGQLTIVSDTLKRYCTLHQEGMGVDIDEPLYKAVELGEFIRCYQEHGECEHAEDCGVTRKALCKKKEKNNDKKT